MKRNAKQTGVGGRLRLAMLFASVAAFLLVPAAVASAGEGTTTIVIEGTGSGKVTGLPGNLEGNPAINCHYTSPGPAGDPEGEVCGPVENGEEAGFSGIFVEHAADPGSEFKGWKILAGSPAACTQESPAAGGCSAFFFGINIVIRATFDLEPGEPLTLTTSGSGSGSFKCDTGSGPEACKPEYPNGTEVEVIPVDGTGSDFVEFNAENGGECAGASCTVIMSEPRSVNAKFDLELLDFEAIVIGEGTVECDVNGGGLGACPAGVDVLTYGDEVEVVATPNAEYVIDSLTGTGSAEGNCNAKVGTCEFTADADSSVTAVFKAAAFKDEAEVETVHGEVPETTTLEAEGCEDVDLGFFIPGVTADYSNTCPVTLTSTGAETTLTASDESAFHTGHLVQGSYFLPSALEVKAVDSEAKGTGPGLTPLSPVTLLTFTEPIAKDATTVTFSQHIGEHDGLHTGEYAKTILLTLAQTA